jgi:uncharacterized cupin superfamily protein
VGITHRDVAPSHRFTIGHIDATWTLLGEVAGCVDVGVRRIAVEPGGWSTPVHEHGRSEEIFYVLSGTGVSYQLAQPNPFAPPEPRIVDVRAGDCIVYLAGRGAHSIHALDEPLVVLAFGPRNPEEAPQFPRLGGALLRGRFVETEGTDRPFPVQFVRESELGPPDVSERHERPTTIVNVADVEAGRLERSRFVQTRRNLGRAVGSVRTGLLHLELAPGTESSPQHCHSAEEEIYVVLEGDGVLMLGDEETPVRAGSVVSLPPGTGVAHAVRAGESGMTLLAYGPREPCDITYYPRSNKIWLRGVGVIGRLEQLDYWDGED